MGWLTKLSAKQRNFHDCFLSHFSSPSLIARASTSRIRRVSILTNIDIVVETTSNDCIHSLVTFITALCFVPTQTRLHEMPRVLSASFDHPAQFAEIIDTSGAQHIGLRHATSAIELRRARQPGYGTPTSRNRKGIQQVLRAAPSLPLRRISHNSLRSVSRYMSSCAKEPFPLLYASESEGCLVHTPESLRSDFHEAYLSPPNSEFGEPPHPSSESGSSESADNFPFPLNAVPLLTASSATATNKKAPQTPKRRPPSASSKYLSPSLTPDRYISSRFSPQDPSKTFRLSKSPHQLSRSEKLIRHDSASPDPFGPLRVPRSRNTGATPTNGDLQALRPRTRLTGATNMLSLPQDALALQTRQASAGAIWNVGGNAQLTHTSPIRSVSNGRGGFISGGSNAPLYTSQFLHKDILDQDLERMEGRLAEALEIDQTSRILKISRTPAQSRSISTGAIGVKRKRVYVQPRTRWRNGEWTVEGSRSREFPLYVSATRLKSPNQDEC